MMVSVMTTGKGTAVVVNYSKDGMPFVNHIFIQPILSQDMFGDIHISHFLGRIRTAPVFSFSATVHLSLKKRRRCDFVLDTEASDDDSTSSGS